MIKNHDISQLHNQKSTLITHIGYAHEGANKNHICAQCGKAFSTNSNLHKHHRNVHEKRKNNVCNFCSKAFGESSDLKKHIEWVHEGVKDKICDLCGMAFGHGHALKRHLRTVHEGIKDHVCNVCSKVRQQNGLFYETLLILSYYLFNFYRHLRLPLLSKNISSVYTKESRIINVMYQDVTDDLQDLQNLKFTLKMSIQGSRCELPKNEII